jgi:hypothetical protein
MRRLAEQLNPDREEFNRSRKELNRSRGELDPCRQRSPGAASALCQGTTLVVPQMQQKGRGALAPEVSFLEISQNIFPLSVALATEGELS